MARPQGKNRDAEAVSDHPHAWIAGLLGILVPTHR